MLQVKKRHTLLGFSLVLAVGLVSVLTTAAGRDASSVRSDAKGRLQLRAIDVGSGRPVPVRVQLVPSALLAPRQVELAPEGQLSLALAPGSYELIVSHGPEWSLFRRTLSVRPGEPLPVLARLEREVDASAFTGCDLHVHTGESEDSDLPHDARRASLAAEDVQVAVLTDHNRVTELPSVPSGTIAVPGVEVTSWAPEFGHFNVFPRKSAPRYQRTSVQAMLRELRADPASFVQINHPRLETHIGYFELTGLSAERRHLPELGFDGLEVWNGYDLTRPSRRDEVFADWLMLLGRGKRLVATGGSDSHQLSAPFAGYPRTYVQLPRNQAHDVTRVVAALKQGRAFVSSGPILEVEAQGMQPGDTLRLRPHQKQVTISIAVSAPRWMDVSRIEVYAGSERVIERPMVRDQVRSELTLEVPVEHAHSLVVVARGERDMSALIGRSGALPYAFSNPIWLRRE